MTRRRPATSLPALPAVLIAVLVWAVILSVLFWSRQ
jgi:hypothetical protein